MKDDWGRVLIEWLRDCWRYEIAVKFEPRDIWVGVHWTRNKWIDEAYEPNLDIAIYICLVPMLPIRFAAFGHDYL